MVERFVPTSLNFNRKRVQRIATSRGPVAGVMFVEFLTQLSALLAEESYPPTMDFRSGGRPLWKFSASSSLRFRKPVLSMTYNPRSESHLRPHRDLPGQNSRLESWYPAFHRERFVDDNPDRVNRFREMSSGVHKENLDGN